MVSEPWPIIGAIYGQWETDCQYFNDTALLLHTNNLWSLFLGSFKLIQSWFNGENMSPCSVSKR